MGTDSVQDLFFSLHDALAQSGLSFGALYCHSTQRKRGKRVVALKSSESCLTSKSSQLPRSSTGLKQMQSDKRATSLRFNLLFAYQTYVAWSESTKRKRMIPSLSQMYVVRVSARWDRRAENVSQRPRRRRKGFL